VGANTRLVEWVSYAQTMPQAALVICHAGHGTLVRALASGATVLAVPHAGDMAENAARADWAGVGVRLPWPLLTPVTLRLAARRALHDYRLRAAARRMSLGTGLSAGPARAADLLQAMALRARADRGARTR
jgi:UDP:flavonoid glycosyltransferase YjiC (YdhE family)